MNNNSIVFDLNKYPDIDLQEFIKYIEDNYFRFGVSPHLFMGKYDVLFECYRDVKNNKFSISGKIKDYSDVLDSLDINMI